MYSRGGGGGWDVVETWMTRGRWDARTWKATKSSWCPQGIGCEDQHQTMDPGPQRGAGWIPYRRLVDFTSTCDTPGMEEMVMVRR